MNVGRAGQVGQSQQVATESQDDSDDRHLSKTSSELHGNVGTKNRQPPVVVSLESQTKRHVSSQYTQPSKKHVAINEQPQSHGQVASEENSHPSHFPPNIIHLDKGDINTCNSNFTNQKSILKHAKETSEIKDVSIPIHSNSDNQEEDDLDDEEAERLEKEIEQEIEDMWQAQLEWEKSQERGEETVAPLPTGDDMDQTLESSHVEAEPHDEPHEDADQILEDHPDELNPHEEPQEGFDQISENSLDVPDGGTLALIHGDKTPEPPDELLDERPPATHLTLKRKDPINQGPEPDLDLSKHSWRSFRGSWILISDETWDALSVEGQRYDVAGIALSRLYLAGQPQERAGEPLKPGMGEHHRTLARGCLDDESSTSDSRSSSRKPFAPPATFDESSCL
ncbi:hypothetical protein J5N97_020763 [Dioscorea zingiberensis]|uniref:Uncharacterized protein n=1 Tax=Dioscorea zingiberensis TaxID=325984 RepID=A0A9D5CH05_9LILI|nr:hypothetical protein J5N97_020763 [Dioscorea zingiberensis]